MTLPPSILEAGRGPNGISEEAMHDEELSAHFRAMLRAWLADQVEKDQARYTGDPPSLFDLLALAED